MILNNETYKKYGYQPDDVAKTSTKFCVLRCDYCQEIFERTMREITRGNKNVKLDACKKKECRNKKYKDVYHQKTAFKIEEINKKRKETCLERFGVENAAQSKEKQEKAEQTRLDKYGYRHVLQSPEIQQKRSNTMMDKYGTLSSLDASGKKDEIIEILKSKSEETAEKGRQTSLKKYGVDNIALLKETEEKRRATAQKRYGVEHISYLQRISFDKINEMCRSKNYMPLFDEGKYENWRQILEFKCLIHDEVFQTRVENLARDVKNCPSCKFYTVSAQEDEIYHFIQENYSGKIIRSERSSINPYEIDIFIPEKKYAIEHNGLYWHSELFKDRSYHKNKFLKAKQKGVGMLQFYEDEWKNQNDVCKSIILNKLELIQNKLYARKLTLNKEPDFTKFQKFLDENHLQKSGMERKTDKILSLEDKEGSIKFCFSAGSFFSNSEEDRKCKYLQIYRVCTERYHVVVGGFSRLFKHLCLWAKENGHERIVTYSDCMYSNGSIYNTCGFKEILHSSPSYYYTDFVDRHTKYRFRAKNGKSEKEIVEELGLCKIYNAGTIRWEYDLSKD